MIDALFAIKNQKRYIIFFTTALTLTSSVKHQRIQLSLKDIILGKMEISHPLLDYLLL